MPEDQPISVQEFTDQIAAHKMAWLPTLEKALPQPILDRALQAQAQTRTSLGLTPSDSVAILGEQTYGLNGKPKVLGKRVLAKALEPQDVKPLELFASYDVAGSEPGIYRMQLPDTNNPLGYTSVNTLPSWKRRRNTATSGFPSQPPEQITQLTRVVQGNYKTLKAEQLARYLSKFHTESASYADANIDLLRNFEGQIGLAISQALREENVDAQLAQNGGMEVMLHLWPNLVREASLHTIPGVRVPNLHETPFQLYHTDPSCLGRMESRFINFGQGVGMESPIISKCMECGHESMATPANVVESTRPLTWRALSRVIAYSTLGLADGHITGGGSIYENTAIKTTEALGLPYFPLINIRKTDAAGNKQSAFNYQSTSALKNGPHQAEAQNFVSQGQASMADLLLSVGAANLKGAIEETILKEVSTTTIISCPPPVGKGAQIIEI